MNNISFWLFTIFVIAIAVWGFILQICERRLIFDRRHVTGFSSFNAQCVAVLMGFFWLNYYAEIIQEKYAATVFSSADTLKAVGIAIWFAMLMALRLLICFIVKEKDISEEDKYKKPGY